MGSSPIAGIQRGGIGRYLLFLLFFTSMGNKLTFSWDTEINIKTRIEIKFYVTVLSLYKKRSGAKFVKNLTKHQRFLKGSLRI